MKQTVWVLLDIAGDAFATVFSSREQALRFLEQDYLGTDRAARLVWVQSRSNLDYWETTDDEGNRLKLYCGTVDEW